MPAGSDLDNLLLLLLLLLSALVHTLLYCTLSIELSPLSCLLQYLAGCRLLVIYCPDPYSSPCASS
jgi:hypothetical protein